MLKRIFILMTIVLLASCGDDEEPSFQRVPYTGDNLRLDGYYYNEYFNTKNYLSAYFLYQDGVVLYGGSFEASRLEINEKQWRTSQWQETVKNHKYSWGIFKVEGSNITFDGFGIGSGKILNDTTFITYEKGSENVYRFKQFSPKPDSINKFIK